MVSRSWGEATIETITQGRGVSCLWCGSLEECERIAFTYAIEGLPPTKGLEIIIIITIITIVACRKQSDNVTFFLDLPGKLLNIQRV